MKTFKNCIECFKNQILKTSELINIDQDKEIIILTKVEELLKNINFNEPPAAIGGKIYHIFHKITNNYDPYKKIKKLYIKKALDLVPFLKNKINKSENRLKTASKISSIGNIIDFGINNSSHIDKNFDILIKELLKKEYYIDNFHRFYEKLKKTKNLIYIGDNAGESVFDMLFIKEIKKEFINIKIKFVTRGYPIINDVVYEDAVESGINKYAEIISSGVDTPGLVLNRSTKKFLDIFNKADLVISKGQGNFEGLSDSQKEIFFILKVKCNVIADYLKVPEGSLIFLHKEKKQKI